MPDTPFTLAYPHLAEWVETRGWIEIGEDDYSRSWVRVLDIGGMVWEGGEDEVSLDAALQAAEVAMAEYLHGAGR